MRDDSIQLQAEAFDIVRKSLLQIAHQARKDNNWKKFSATATILRLLRLVEKEQT